MKRGNQAIVDRFTLAHLAVGAVAREAGVSFAGTVVGAIAWEAFEPLVKRSIPRLFPRPTLDSPQNKIGDLAAFLGGWLLWDRYRAQA